MSLESTEPASALSTSIGADADRDLIRILEGYDVSVPVQDGLVADLCNSILFGPSQSYMGGESNYDSAHLEATLSVSDGDLSVNEDEVNWLMRPISSSAPMWLWLSVAICWGVSLLLAVGLCFFKPTVLHVSFSQPEAVVAAGAPQDVEVAGVPAGPICPLPPACPTDSTGVLSLPPPPPPPDYSRE